MNEPERFYLPCQLDGRLISARFLCALVGAGATFTNGPKGELVLEPLDTPPAIPTLAPCGTTAPAVRPEHMR